MSPASDPSPDGGPVAAFRDAVSSGSLALPRPGAGDTDRRFAALWELGRRDLSLARLGEAHADAVAILEEAGRAAPADADGLAVWAAEGPGSELTATVNPDGVRLEGAKRWCSGAGIVSHALVTARCGDDGVLVLVPLHHHGVQVFDDGWVSPAFAATSTNGVRFEVDLGADSIVGPPGFYLDRPGFWYGAVGVAACWAGGAAGLLEVLEPRCRPDSHGRAAVGAARAACWAMQTHLDAAARLIDAGTLDDQPSRRQALALTVRHLVDVTVGFVIETLTRAAGPGPLAHDADVARRIGELQLYVRQCHAERDLDVLGGLPSPPLPR